MWFLLRPRSYTTLMFLMKPSKTGIIEGQVFEQYDHYDILVTIGCNYIFHRSLKITVNQWHNYNVPVHALINELSLELSSKAITLSEQNSVHINTGTYILHVYILCNFATLHSSC